MKLLQRFLAAIAVAAAALGITLAAAQPAAASSTYVWNDVRGSVQVWGLPCACSGVSSYNLRNGTHLTMYCWLDNAGNRWFKFYEISGYIQANWVYGQTPVRHC